MIDREADSIAHFRKLAMQNVNWLIRGKEGQLVDRGHPPRPLATPAAIQKGRGFHTDQNTQAASH